jgi:hypothetical protein
VGIITGTTRVIARADRKQDTRITNRTVDSFNTEVHERTMHAAVRLVKRAGTRGTAATPRWRSHRS